MNYTEEATKNLTPSQKEKFNMLFGLVRKSEKKAYFWWAVSSIFGGHRIYLGHHKIAMMMIMVTIFTCGIGGIVGLIDIINIKRLTHEYNKDKILKSVKVVKTI
jgi:TM2 domain-containing membrane protein YozV